MYTVSCSVELKPDTQASDVSSCAATINSLQKRNESWDSLGLEGFIRRVLHFSQMLGRICHMHWKEPFLKGQQSYAAVTQSDFK